MKENGCAISRLVMEGTLRKECRWPLEAEYTVPQVTASNEMGGLTSPSVRNRILPIAWVSLGMLPPKNLPNKIEAWQATSLCEIINRASNWAHLDFLSTYQWDNKWYYFKLIIVLFVIHWQKMYMNGEEEVKEQWLWWVANLNLELNQKMGRRAGVLILDSLYFYLPFIRNLSGKKFYNFPVF